MTKFHHPKPADSITNLCKGVPQKAGKPEPGTVNYPVRVRYMRGRKPKEPKPAAPKKAAVFSTLERPFEEERVCAKCGQVYTAHSHNAKYCPDCRRGNTTTETET